MLQYRNIHGKPMLFLCRLVLITCVVFPSICQSQIWIDYKINPRGDTINRIDKLNRKQGPWWFRYEEVRGEPGFEEEGYFYNDKKQGTWKKFSLMGDLIAREYFIAGYKDGRQFYYSPMGNLIREESWKAVDPANPYDTIMVPDLDNPERVIKKIIKHESAEIKHGVWNYYDPVLGGITKTERFIFGQPEKGLLQKNNKDPLKTDAKPNQVILANPPAEKKSANTQKKGKN